MSDLHCAATLLVVGSGPARYAAPGVPSDANGGLTPASREQLRGLAHRLRSRRVAAVYSSVTALAVESAGVAGDALGVPVTTVAGLEELGAGEGQAAALARFQEALEGIADLHRGESVLVVSHESLIALAVRRLCGDTPDDLPTWRSPDVGAVAEVSIDADGWRLDAWPDA